MTTIQALLVGFILGAGICIVSMIVTAVTLVRLQRHL